MFDTLPGHSRIVILDTHIDFRNSRADIVPCASALRVIAVQARLKRAEQHAAIELFAKTLAFKQRELRMISMSQFTNTAPTSGLGEPSALGSETDLRITSMASSINLRGMNFGFAGMDLILLALTDQATFGKWTFTINQPHYRSERRINPSPGKRIA
jgi:hypothetical protein